MASGGPGSPCCGAAVGLRAEEPPTPASHPFFGLSLIVVPRARFVVFFVILVVLFVLVALFCLPLFFLLFFWLLVLLLEETNITNNHQ